MDGKGKLASAFVVLLPWTGIAGVSSVHATVLPEKITENMTLTAAASPYTGGVVTVESGVTDSGNGLPR